MNKIELKIDYDEFCNWYFDDRDNASSTVQELIRDGVVSIQCIANKVGIIPLELLQNEIDVDYTDVDYDELEVNDKYKIILTRK